MDSTAQAEPVATASYPSASATTSAATAEAAATERGSFCVNLNPATKRVTGTISGRFLHSEENLEECYVSTDDDDGDTDFEEDNGCCEDDEDNDDTEEFHRKATAFSRSREGVMRALSNHSLEPPGPPQSCPPSSTASSQQTTDKSNRSAAAEQRLHQRHTNNQQNQRQQQKHKHKQQHHWARRQLYRSVSVDDLMEYQREFSLAAVGRTSSDHKINTHTTIITEYQREFQAILAGQQHEILRNNNNHTKNTTPTIEEPSVALALASTAAPPVHQKVSRKSIANSDLADFKRQMSQMQLADQQGDSGDNKEEKGGTTDSASANNNMKGSLVESKVLSDKLDSLQKDASDYQWGTRSLRRAILGSDLGTFERSVRTALLETSRENSSDSLVCPDDDDCDNNGDGQGESNNTAQETNNNGGQIHEPLAEQAKNEHDWGTRSLRKSIKELDCMDDSSRRQYQSHSSAGPTHQTSSGSASSRQMSNILEDGEIMEMELDTPLQYPSPWQDDKQNPPSVNGLKMPRRVTSNENVQHSPSVNGLKMPRRVTSNESVHGRDGDGEDQQANNNGNNNNTDDNLTTDATSTQSRRSSMNDMSVVSSTPDQAGGPEYEWQMRTRFRRSISSSDIEKYQRHLTALEEDSERLSDSEGDDQSLHTVAVVESVSAAARMPPTAALPASVNAHSLLAPASVSNVTSCPWDPSDEKKKSSSNAKPTKPKRDRKPRRRHRRSTSDEPELHMDNIISDVAPRKPTRTNSRPISPPPPRRAVVDRPAAVVRFADNNNQVVEIPKVSEDMKPFLFYTKRDVKRFRMNEHRRQEEQIRSYVEYLNQKENALDASQCW